MVFAASNDRRAIDAFVFLMQFIFQCTFLGMLSVQCVSLFLTTHMNFNRKQFYSICICGFCYAQHCFVCCRFLWFVVVTLCDMHPVALNFNSFTEICSTAIENTYTCVKVSVYIYIFSAGDSYRLLAGMHCHCISMWVIETKKKKNWKEKRDFEKREMWTAIHFACDSFARIVFAMFIT